MKRICADAVYWVALAHKKDQWHQRAVDAKPHHYRMTLWRISLVMPPITRQAAQHSFARTKWKQLCLPESTATRANLSASQAVCDRIAKSTIRAHQPSARAVPGR